MKTEAENDMAQEKLVDVDIPIAGEIELPTIDVSKWIGKRAVIESAKVKKGTFGYLVQVQTQIVETITGGKDPIDIRGSRLFGLQTDDQGNVGWGKSTKLGLFMAKMKAKTLKDLIGKQVVLQSMTAKSGSEFLTFN